MVAASDRRTAAERSDVIRETLLPFEAPASLKVAMLGVYAVSALAVVDLLVTLAYSPNGGAIVVSLVLALGLAYLAVAMGRGLGWARLVTIGVAVVLLLLTFGQFRDGIPLWVQGVAVGELVVLIGVVVLLVVPATNDWFRTPR